MTWGIWTWGGGVWSQGEDTASDALISLPAEISISASGELLVDASLRGASDLVISTSGILKTSASLRGSSGTLVDTGFDDDIVEITPAANPALISSIIDNGTMCVVRIETGVGILGLKVPPVAPPTHVAQIMRRSITWPAPALDGSGRPVNWQFSSQVFAEWGLPQLVVDSTDVTYYRGIPTVIEGWSIDEPFDDAMCSFTFPQITVFEALPSWLKDGATVEINLVPAGGGATIPLFEGQIVSIGASVDENSNHIPVTATGALFDLDRFIAGSDLVAHPPYDIASLMVLATTQAASPGVKISQLVTPLTGVTTNKLGNWGPVLTDWIGEMLSTAWTEGGDQWTLMKDMGRVPKLRLKDRTTVHWTVRAGQPGLVLSLERDFSMAFTTYFGEGTDPDGCRWRNAQYPNLRPDDAPVFGGNIFTVGESGSDFLLFEQELVSKGYHFDMDGHYDSAEVTQVKNFQRAAGISVDGAVGPQTWAAAFEPGASGGDLFGGYYFPIAFYIPSQPFFAGAQDKIPNPLYDPTVVRRERFQSYGAGVWKYEAADSAVQQMLKSKDAPVVGTITLTADPIEDSRFRVRAGQNIQVRGYRGVDTLFHIASAQIDWINQKVDLEVDTAARDAMSLAEIRKRNRENQMPSWKREQPNRTGRSVETRQIVWDCESGAGIIPRHATYRGLWNVLRIPTGDGGNIAGTTFQVDTPARFAIGIFNRPITAAELRAQGTPVQFTDYWSVWDENSGLVIAWGQGDQMGGFSPGRESNEDPLTGKLIDDAQWYFDAGAYAPWLWVCEWVESPTVNYIQGRLHPGVLG